jgi:hypothetical protein
LTLRSERRFYDWEGASAPCRGPQFPRVVHRGESVVYERDRFFHRATPISEQQFEGLTAETLR